MKKFSILSIAIVIAFSCNQKKQEVAKNADILGDNLKGKVEQTTETDYKVDSSGKMGEQDSCCVVTEKYDEKGYLTQYTSDNKAGTEKMTTVYTHDDNGAMKSAKGTKNGTADFSITTQIDKDGKYIGAQETDTSGKPGFYYNGISQNDYGQLTALKKYHPDSTLASTMTSTYDKQFFKSNEVKDSLGKLQYSSAVKLDDKNNIVERATRTVIKDSTTNKVTRYKYTSFDDQGNWTERTEMDESGKPVKITKREITFYKE